MSDGAGATAGESGTPRTAGASGAAGEPSAAGASGASGAAASAAGHSASGASGTSGAVWSDDSRSIAVRCAGFFQGSMRFEAGRDALSAKQLELLSQVKTTSAQNGCPTDLMSCKVSVTNSGGVTAETDAIEMDPACDTPRTVIEFASFMPFLASLGCRFAKDASDFVLGPDARCFNGVFFPSGGGTTRLPLQIDAAAAPRHLELDDCDAPGRAGKLTFSVLDADGITKLASSLPPASPGADHSCARLDYTFPHTGRFLVDVVAAPDALPAGDLSFRFY
jgi:hypothetical protein